MVFEFSQNGYTVRPAEFKRSTGRRGPRAECDFYRGGRKVATLHDEPEKIVAQVDFVDEAERELMRKTATLIVGDPSYSDEHLISDFARNLTYAADEAWVAAPVSKGGLNSRGPK